MLTGKQKRYLRALAVTESPVVQVGKAGLTDTIVTETTNALLARELVKVRVLPASPDEPQDIFAQLSERCGAEWVQTLGRNGVFYKQSPDKPKIQLPE